jgi:hypothetical protein
MASNAVTQPEFDALELRLQLLKQSDFHKPSSGDDCQLWNARTSISPSDFPAPGSGLSNPMFHGRRTANDCFRAGITMTPAEQCNLLDLHHQQRQQFLEASSAYSQELPKTQDTSDMQHQRCLDERASFRLLSQIKEEDEAREALEGSNEEASLILVHQLQSEEQPHLLEDNGEHKTLVKMAIDEFSSITNPTSVEIEYIRKILINELVKLALIEQRTDEEKSDYDLYRVMFDSLGN